MSQRVVVILEELQNFLRSSYMENQETFSFTLEVLADMTRFKESVDEGKKRGYIQSLHSLNNRAGSDRSSLTE